MNPLTSFLRWLDAFTSCGGTAVFLEPDLWLLIYEEVQPTVRWMDEHGRRFIAVRPFGIRVYPLPPTTGVAMNIDYSENDPRATDLIDKLFTYHPPKGTLEQPRRYSVITAKFKELAEFLNKELPPGPDKTVALRSLSRARMDANLTIACNE